MTEATTVHEDNQACIAMIANNIVSGRNKHMELKMHYVRERVQAGDVKIEYVKTSEQRADILTKNLPRPTFERLRDLLLDPSSRAEVSRTTTAMGKKAKPSTCKTEASNGSESVCEMGNE